MTTKIMVLTPEQASSEGFKKIVKTILLQTEDLFEGYSTIQFEDQDGKFICSVTAKDQ